MTHRPHKHAAIVMAQSLLTTLTSVRYNKAADDEDRAWTLLLDLCEALHPLGSVSIPPRGRVVEMVHRIERDEEIRRAFNGRNYNGLAAQYRMTPRRIRSIIGVRGWRTHK